MYPVYLLEDDFEQQKLYSKVINEVISSNNCEMELYCQTMSPLELLSAAQANPSNEGLFFMDMEIDENPQAGLQAAMRIRELLPAAQIVFITIHEEFAFLTLENRIAPMDFIIKDHGFPVVERKMREDIMRTVAMFCTGNRHHPQMFTYRVGQRYYAVPLDDIMFLSTSNSLPGHVILHGTNQEAEFLGSLTDLNHRYPSLFRCDKSFLVNLNQKCFFNNKTKELRFTDGSIAYVSLRKTKDLLRRFQ